MKTAELYTNWWKGGKRFDLLPGYHNNVVGNIGSMYIPDGIRVKFWEDATRTKNESRWFYPGDYEEVYQSSPTGAGCVLVEECAVDRTDLVEFIVLGYNNYRSRYNLPIGEFYAGIHTFPNDAIDEIIIPLGMTVEVFADGLDSGTGSLIFTGLPGGNRINLESFGYKDVITSVKITADDWELAGIELQDAEIEESTREVIAGHLTLHNNSSSPDTLSGQTTVQSEDSSGSQWDVSAGVSFTSETTIKGGVAGFGEFEQKFGMTLELAAGYGQNESHSKGESFTVEATMEVPPHSSKSASIIIHYGTLKAQARRTWRNKRTGQTIQETGTIFSAKGYKAEVSTRDGV